MFKKRLLWSLKYLTVTLYHKWFVLIAGLKLKCSLWRLLTHDLSKFSPYELPHYGRQFYGDKQDGEAYARCWLHHIRNNQHHSEYYILGSGTSHGNPPYDDNAPIPMPEGAVREMIADWLGAGRAYAGAWERLSFEGDNWLSKNKDKLVLHSKTIGLIKIILDEYNS